MRDAQYELVTLNGIACGCGTTYVYPSAIEDDAHHTTAECPTCDTNSGIQIDDYDLHCEPCRIRVSRSFGLCPVDPSHALVSVAS